MKKILIVDDEKETCSVFKNYFTRRGHDISIAYDGLEAKRLLEDNKYDFIFFDCNMPELSGVELLKIIQQKNPESRKIMVSGYELMNEDFAKDLGVDIFLKKPISLEKLGEIIR